MRRIVVVGGGISGLAAAHQLIAHSSAANNGRPPYQVTLLEASPRLGGTVRTHERDGFLLEGGPDSFISEKPEAIQLAKTLGIADRLIETNSRHRRSFVVRAGRLRPVPEGFYLLAPSRFWPFVTSDIFSWTGKARIALDLVLPRRALASDDDDESLADFVRRRLGREALERIAQPMVGGIYTADPERLSLRATMPRFLEMERTHRSLIGALRRKTRTEKTGAAESRGTSGARYSLFLSFDRGMQTLTDTLADTLAATLPHNSVRLNTAVESLALDRATGGWMLHLSDGEMLHADGVCLALPAYRAAKLLADVDGQLAAELAAILYASSATINLAYRRADIPHPLDGFGFVTPAIERLATLACTFSSVKFPGRAPEGHVLLRAFVGGALQPDMFALDEEKMIRAVRKDLHDLLGIKQPPLFTLVEKWPGSLAQYHLGHLARIRRINDRLKLIPTLQLAGNAYQGAGLPDCIRGSHQAADHLIGVMSDR